MAAAVSIARYLLDEASSGTSPTTAADDEAGGHDLDVDYGTSDANWSSNADGNGLDFTDEFGTAIADIGDMSAASSIGGQLDGETEASVILVARVDTGRTTGSRILALGTDGGNAEIAIVITPDRLETRFVNESPASGSWNFYTHASSDFTLGAEHIIHVVFDTTESTQGDRAKLYIDNVLQSPTTTQIESGSALATQNANISFSLGNRPTGNREINGAVWYAEIFTGKLTTDEISDSYDALLLDHDANWAAVADEDVGALFFSGDL